MKTIVIRLAEIDRAVDALLHRHGHPLQWFGLLKPFGIKTTTSILAHTVYWGDPEYMVPLLGWWGVAIGVALMWRPLVRLALLLLSIRLPGTILALIVHPEVCWVGFPLAPTPEGQYLIKDVTLFFAALAIAGSARERSA
jgi:hypothetical protein